MLPTLILELSYTSLIPFSCIHLSYQNNFCINHVFLGAESEKVFRILNHVVAHRLLLQIALISWVLLFSTCFDCCMLLLEITKMCSLQPGSQERDRQRQALLICDLQQRAVTYWKRDLVSWLLQQKKSLTSMCSVAPQENYTLVVWISFLCRKNIFSSTGASSLLDKSLFFSLFFYIPLQKYIRWGSPEDCK